MISKMSLLICCWLTAISGLSGCSSSSKTDDGFTPVSGTVTLGGTPIADGIMEFRYDDGVTPAGLTTIKEGKYSLKLAQGTVKVMISAPAKVGEKPVYEGDTSGPMEDITKESVPDKYNTKSTLSLNVGAEPIEKSFELEVK